MVTSKILQALNNIGVAEKDNFIKSLQILLQSPMPTRAKQVKDTEIRIAIEMTKTDWDLTVKRVNKILYLLNHV